MKPIPGSIYDPDYGQDTLKNTREKKDRVTWGKLIIIGDAESGKTSTANMYCSQKFNTNYLMTLGANFYSKNIEVEDERVEFVIWDFAGQPHFSSVRSEFYKGSNACLVMFDLTREKTFKNVPNWIVEMGRKIKDPIPIVLVGNKIDLVYKDPLNRQVHKDDVREYAIQFVEDNPGYRKKGLFDTDPKTGKPCLPYFETSASTGEKVEKVFETAIRMYLKSSHRAQ